MNIPWATERCAQGTAYDTPNRSPNEGSTILEFKQTVVTVSIGSQAGITVAVVKLLEVLESIRFYQKGKLLTNARS